MKHLKKFEEKLNKDGRNFYVKDNETIIGENPDKSENINFDIPIVTLRGNFTYNDIPGEYVVEIDNSEFFIEFDQEDFEQDEMEYIQSKIEAHVQSIINYEKL